MLPLLRNHYYIGLHPRYVQILCRERGFKKAIVENICLPCAKADGAQSTWQASLETLSGWLLQRPTQEKADATVVLSNAFVRYLTLPWHEEKLTSAEEATLSGLAFENIYGGKVGDWHINFSCGGYGSPSVASAIEKALLQQVEARLEEHSVRLKSLCPYLMTVFNAFRTQFAASNFQFAIVEQNNLLIATVGNRHWQSIRIYPLSGDVMSETMKLIRREALLNADPEPSICYLFAPEWPTFANLNESGIALKMLNPVLPKDMSSKGMTYGLALSGVC